ncbi:MAG: WG repeat-containing protein [Sphingobacteriaceae bacterium]|nr:MAG: WG repeat-containing protein [Sphingobacteriaceae bacterium]
MRYTKFQNEDTGLFGFKDKYGTIVIEPRFDRVEPVYNGFAPVEQNEKWGLVNINDELIIPCEYDSLYAPTGNWVHATIKNKQYLLTAEGECILKVEDILSWNKPEDDIIRIKKSSGWGCINMRGETIIPCRYKSLGQVKNGRLSFFEDCKWGWLDVKGQVISPPIFEQLGFWGNQYWWGRNEAGYTIYDFDNSIVINKGWERVEFPGNDGMAVVKTATGWKYIDNKFETILQLKPGYEWASRFFNGLGQVKKNGLWGFINETGEEIIKPEYELAGFFFEELAAVKKGGLWGYINLNGDFIINPQYKGARSFNNGEAEVNNGWHSWFINHKNEAISQPELMDDYTF